MKICSNCGKQCVDNATFCDGCGRPFAAAPQQPYQPTYQQQPYQPQPPVYPPQNQNVPQAKKTSVSLILGIVGIVFSWIFAIIGHATSIVGIVLGIKEYKETNKITGLAVSIVGEVFSIISSIVGAVTMASLF